MNCSICNSEMWLSFSGKKVPDGHFYWKCSNYSVCTHTQNYTPIQPAIDFVEGDISQIMMDFGARPDSEQVVLITEIKSQMVRILKHFIGCTWGAHFMTQYYQLIYPYLDNANVLDFVLKSDVILEKTNIVKGITGAKIFPGLAKMLLHVHSSEIKKYLKKEFPSYFG